MGADPYALMPMLGSLRELSRTVVATREPHRSLVRLPVPGGVRWIDLRLEPWGDGFLFFSRDVTAEQAALSTAEASASQRDALLRDALGALGDMVVVLRAVRDDAGRIVDEEVVYANPAWRREFLGSDDVDPAGWTILARLPHMADRLDRDRRVIETGEPFRSVLEIPGRTGSFDLGLVRFGDGLIAVARDATPFEEARAAVAESEARFRLIAENASDVVYRSTPDGVFEWVSPSITEVLGWTPEEAIGAWVFDYLHPDDVTRIAAEGMSVNRGSPAAFEGRYRRPDDTYRWLSVRVHPVVDAEGRIVARIGSARDIEAEHQALEALRAREADLAEAQRIAHVGSWVYRAAGGEVEWSAEVLRMFGLTPERRRVSVAEQSRLLGPETLAERNAAIDRTMRTGEPFEIQFDIRRIDGAVRHLLARGEALRDARGATVGAHGTVADVTEAQEAQARFDQASRAELVGRLAGGVAHEFNNILAAIGGYAELLAESIPTDDPRHADVDAIIEAGSRAAVLTRQLLAFGRRQALQPSIVDAGVVVEGLISLLRSLVPADVELVVEREAATGTIRADRPQLEQAVVNLVLNARDAMPRGGRIAIGIDEVTVEAADPILRPPARPGRYVRVSVADTGTGIDDETLEHIFEPFFTTKGPGHGSGLGLSSVDGFVVQSGGFVAVTSDPGRGSTFSIHLPVATGDAPAQPGDATAPPGTDVSVGGPERILLVEDQLEVRTVTARTLRDLGYEVLAVADPQAALVAVDEVGGSIDLLITDMVMPVMSGRDLARLLARRRPGLPVLFISGYAAGSGDGADIPDAEHRILAKPFGREELASRVRALLDRPDARSG